jgi:hypothetical protein
VVLDRHRLEKTYHEACGDALPATAALGCTDEREWKEPPCGQGSRKREAQQRQAHAGCIDEALRIEAADDLTHVFTPQGATPNPFAWGRLVDSEGRAEIIERDESRAGLMERAEHVRRKGEGLIGVHVDAFCKESANAPTVGGAQGV